jgi:hypothetical protein
LPSLLVLADEEPFRSGDFHRHASRCAISGSVGHRVSPLPASPIGTLSAFTNAFNWWPRSGRCRAAASPSWRARHRQPAWQRRCGRSPSCRASGSSAIGPSGMTLPRPQAAHRRSRRVCRYRGACVPDVTLVRRCRGRRGRDEVWARFLAECASSSALLAL